MALAARRRSLEIRTPQIIHSFVVLAGASVVLVTVLSIAVSPWRALAWLVPLNIVSYSARRAAQRIRAQLDQADAEAIGRFENALFWRSVICAQIVGLGVWWLGTPPSSRSIQFLVTFLQVLYSLGSMINMSTHPRTFVAAVWLTTVPAIVFWITQGLEGYAVAGSLACLAILMSRFSFLIKADFNRSVRIGLENAELVRQLGIEKAATERAREAAEAANVAKSRFLAAASHDLRQPVHALNLFTSLLDGVSGAERDELLTHIRSTSASLSKLFGGLMDLSKLDAGAVHARPKPTELASLVQAIYHELEPNARQKGLALKVDVSKQWIETDPFLLERVLRNLLDNAIKYTDHGAVGIRAVRGDGTVDIEVWDTGPGIGPEHRVQVFDEFFQLNNPERNPEKGAGLGLAIVKRLCNLLEHGLRLDSEPGQGSRFTVQVPLTESPASEESRFAPRAVQADLRGKRICVIDDDARVQAAMRRQLLAWGAVPLVYPSLDALQTASGNEIGPIDALIADFRLNGNTTGFDVVERLRALAGNIPAAIFTGEVNELKAESERMPDVPIFQKPVSPDEMCAWLHDALAESRAARLE